MLVGEVWAAKSSSGLTSVGLDSTGSPSPLKNLSAATFTLPRELGYIQESTEIPNSSKTVIHIQDAHCNYAAQKTIAEILNYLTSEYGISAVNCEGAAESYDLSPFTAISEKDIREKTSNFFVKEGVVSAAEYYAVNNPQKVNLWGVEDPDLYLKDLKIYRDSLAHKDEVDKYIKSIEYILNNLKRHIYSDELLKFDNYYTGYKEGKVSFKEYILYLINMAQKRMIDIKSFSNLYLLSQTLEEEDKINFKRANNEKDEVVDKLKKSLSKNELQELMVMVGKLKSERISQADFYSYLAKKAKSVKLDMSGYSELQKYIIYISLYSAVDRTKVTKEIDSLEDRIKASLYENDTQRELGILSKNLAITKNMFNISLTRDDYSYYKEHVETFDVANYVSFIDKKAPLYKISAVLNKNIGMLDEYRDSMNQFYECSLERDKAFVKNIKFTDNDRPNSIIITGGFHTENLRELFKNEKVSYVSIMPKFSNKKGYDSPYMKRLAGQRTALENVIDTAIPAVLNLQVVEILSKELAIRVEGEAGLARFRLAVAIISALMRGQKFIFKINREAYPERDRPQEDKVVVFNSGEGGNISSTTTLANEPNFTELANRANATLTAINVNDFAFSTQPQPEIAEAEPPAPVVEAPPAAEGPVPVIKPSFVIVDGKPQPIVPAEQVPIAATPLGETMYKDAVNPAVGIASVIRKNTATRMVMLVATEEDRSAVASYGQMARNIMGPDTYIHINSYLAKDDWMPNLRELLNIELRNFVESDMVRNAPLMDIRIKEGADTRKDIDQMINDILVELGYQEKSEDIRGRIRIVQVQMEPGKRTNPAIEFFADIGMLECDRYINGDYGDENRVPPQDLQDNFLALLKLSVKNSADFDGKSISEILKMIFTGHLLEIRPADFKSFDEWNRANRQLLQSV